MVRGFVKKAYYYTLNPLYKVVKAEAADEARSIVKDQAEYRIEQLEQQVEKLSKELERLRKADLDYQSRVAHQVSEEFVKMYTLIEDIQTDQTDVKLNVTIVSELVKIHQSIEALKYDRNGRD